ncbi:MAG: hypothetical protein ACLVJH_03495 [Faecalibacterium prausnitzii]
MAQVNHYLAVSGFDCWYIAALIFGKELVIHKITTDKEVLNNLIAKEEHFWKYNVMPEIPPVPTGSEGDTQQINQLYSADDRNKTADLNPIRNLLDKRQELSRSNRADGTGENGYRATGQAANAGCRLWHSTGL